jgi:hypothetical protein
MATVWLAMLSTWRLLVRRCWFPELVGYELKAIWRYGRKCAAPRNKVTIDRLLLPPLHGTEYYTSSNSIYDVKCWS